jgi:hypothetical protein
VVAPSSTCTTALLNRGLVDSWVFICWVFRFVCRSSYVGKCLPNLCSILWSYMVIPNRYSLYSQKSFVLPTYFHHIAIFFDNKYCYNFAKIWSKFKKFCSPKKLEVHFFKNERSIYYQYFATHRSDFFLRFIDAHKEEKGSSMAILAFMYPEVWVPLTRHLFYAIKVIRRTQRGERAHQ